MNNVTNMSNSTQASARHLYNVIWVDDEIDALYSSRRSRGAELNRQCFERRGINVFPARNMNEFNRLMKDYQDRIDAVITDINFSAFGDSYMEEGKDTTGFEEIRETRSRYQAFGREIPFFIFSGKLDLFTGSSYFNNKRFSKNQLEALLDALTKEVDHIQSPSFRVRKKYGEDLDTIGKIFPDKSEFLFGELLKLESGEKGECIFNGARKVIERILSECVNLGLIPEGISALNEKSKFLEGKVINVDNKEYHIKKDSKFLPEPLAKGMKWVLQITHGGSHDGNIDKLITGDRHLYTAVLHIVMALCLWYKDYSYNNHDIEENRKKWVCK